MVYKYIKELCYPDFVIGAADKQASEAAGWGLVYVLQYALRTANCTLNHMHQPMTPACMLHLSRTHSPLKKKKIKKKIQLHISQLHN